MKLNEARTYLDSYWDRHDSGLARTPRVRLSRFYFIRSERSHNSRGNFDYYIARERIKGGRSELVLYDVAHRYLRELPDGARLTLEKHHLLASGKEALECLENLKRKASYERGVLKQV